jgi:sucrose-6-phosphate hydrolase SacC (GH32 family)
MILAVDDHVELYGSKNLTSWAKLSEFGKTYGAHGGVWECPDLFPLSVNGGQKWVLLLSINPGGIHGGSATQYFIGNFDGKTFTSDNPPDKTLWLDYGKDNYAGVTWANIPPSDGRRIFMGWMSNWEYANVVPTSPWRSAMTIPRELSLRQLPEGIRLVARPVKELAAIRGESADIPAQTLLPFLLPNWYSNLTPFREATILAWSFTMRRGRKLWLATRPKAIRFTLTAPRPVIRIFRRHLPAGIRLPGNHRVIASGCIC